MKDKIIKILFVFTISLFLSSITYKFCYLIAERHFFDKFFYQKSVSHGYWVQNKLKYEFFGDRSKDIRTLVSENQDFFNSPPPDDTKYNIAIIGDSFVWGQGVKNNQIFSKLLEKKLNKIRPTKIFMLGNSGDNIFENYLKYQQSINAFGPMDLYIFGFVDNDLLFNSNNRYGVNTFIDKHKIDCPENALFNASQDEQSSNTNLYSALITDSLKEGSQNYCIFRKIAPLFPTKNTIYLNLSSTFKNTTEILFTEILSKNFSPILPLPITPGDPTLYVSKSEQHPSTKAHQIFADSLFKEITTNQKYNF